MSDEVRRTPDAVGLTGQKGRNPLVRLARRQRLGVAGVVSIAAVMLVIGVGRRSESWRDLFRHRDANPRLTAIIAAVGDARWIEPRLTGGFDFRPLQPAARAASANNLPLLAAAGQLQRAVNVDPSADNLHGWGVAALLLGRHDDAIGALERAAGRTKRDPAIRSDLAAAYVVRATLPDHADDWPRAVASAEEAIALDAASLPARFNSALALTKLGLSQQARAAWNAYLALDRDSQWAVEGRRHLTAIDRAARFDADPHDLARLLSDPSLLKQRAAALSAAPQLDRQLARELVEDALIPMWGRRHIAAASDADEFLAIAGTLVARLSDDHDRLLGSTLDEIRRADSRTRSRLARGVVEFGDARLLYESDKTVVSVEVFRRARQDLSAAHSSFRHWPALYLAIGEYYAVHLESARSALLQIRRAMAGDAFRAISALTLWMLGLVSALEGKLGESIDDYLQSQALFRQLGEPRNLAAVDMLLAASYSYLGARREAWQHYSTALESLGGLQSPRRAEALLIAIATDCLRNDLPAAARQFAAEAVRRADAWGQPLAMAESRNHLARSLIALEQTGSAAAALAESTTIASRVSDEALSSRLRAEQQQTQSELESRRDPGKAIALASAAADRFASLGADLRRARLLVASGRARRSLGDQAGAVADLQRALPLQAGEQAGLTWRRSLRDSHTDDVWPAAQYTVETLLDGGQTDLAFVVWNQARARFMGDGQALSDTPPQAIARRLAPGQGLLLYIVLESRLNVWCIGGPGVQHSVVTVSRDEIRSAASALLEIANSSRRSIDEWRQRIATLSNWLVAPITACASQFSQVTIVPDDALWTVPFHLLSLGEPRAMLMEKMAVALAPLAIGGPQNPVIRPRASFRDGVIVEAGAGANALGFGALPFVGEEVERVHQITGGPVVHAASAPLSDVWRAVEQASLLHFAGHAMLNDQYPLLSGLVMTTADGPQVLAAWEIIDHRLRADLVCLSACSTQVGHLVRGVGASSLAHAFLAAGAKAVVASLWNVDDRATLSVMSDFYQLLSSGVDVAGALRGAMRNAARDRPLEPWLWAPFVVTVNS